MGNQRHSPVALPLGKRRTIHCTGGWVGLRASLDGCVKSRLIRSSIPALSSFLTSRCTDYAILALSVYVEDVIPVCNVTH